MFASNYFMNLTTITDHYNLCLVCLHLITQCSAPHVYYEVAQRLILKGIGTQGTFHPFHDSHSVLRGNKVFLSRRNDCASI